MSKRYSRRDAITMSAAAVTAVAAGSVMAETTTQEPGPKSTNQSSPSTPAVKDSDMRIVTLEEHFLLPSLVESHFGKTMITSYPDLTRRLGNLDKGRVRDMDESGITVQVLSCSMPGASEIDGEEGIKFAKLVNDELARAVRLHPGRFAGFAHLPMRTPEAAADELERAVRDLGFRGGLINGLADGRFLDDPRFEPVLSRFEALDVPLYLHPNVPPKAVHEAYYGDLPGNLGQFLSTGMMGWHSETGIHVFRLALSGTLARHPRLRIIIGHMGEMLPFQLARADDVLQTHAHFNKPISEIILDRVTITTSGYFSNPPFMCALMTFGADRIMFSVDYPYSNNVQGRAFLDGLPISPDDKLKIAHKNADRILKLDTAKVS